MNAYELADELELWAQDVYGGGQQFKYAANMLRQQADYIKHLEEGLESSLKLNKAQAERQDK